MDRLSDILNNMSVRKSAIDEFIEKIENIDELGRKRAEYEWNNVQEIHSKLSYLIEYFNDGEFDLTLLISLTRFLQHIDMDTIRYIKDIEWDHDCEVQEEVYQLFEKSLTLDEPLGKLDVMDEAYQKILLVLEDFGLFAMPKKFEQPFLAVFPLKRRRIE